MIDRRRAHTVLTMNTMAFTVCFAVWILNGVLIAFLVRNWVYGWDKAQMGWLIGIPVLTGSVTLLPVGMLTDRCGGRSAYSTLLPAAAVPKHVVSFAKTYFHFLLAGLVPAHRRTLGSLFGKAQSRHPVRHFTPLGGQAAHAGWFPHRSDISLHKASARGHFPHHLLVATLPGGGVEPADTEGIAGNITSGVSSLAD